MKTTILTTAALIGAVLFPAIAFSETVQGCEIVDMGGYSNKADPTCVFNHQPGGNWSPAGSTASLPPGTTIQDYIDDMLNG